jgi:hypothetical protein
MTEYRLGRRVGEVADRMQWLQSLRSQATLFLLGAAIGLGLLAANHWLPAPLFSAGLTLAAGCLLLGVCWMASRRRSPSLEQAAVAIEKRWPGLDSRLVTAIDQRPDSTSGGFRFLQQEVIGEAWLHGNRHDWRDAVPARDITRAKFRQLASMLLFVGAFSAAAWVAHARRGAAAAARLADADAATSADYVLTVEPGDAVIERGTGLLVIARFEGRMPPEVLLHATDAEGKTTSLPLSRSLDDPLFGGRLPTVETDLSYHVTFDGRQSDAYRVQVFDYPQLERADAVIVHPDYTGLGEKTIEDVRRLSVVEGSQLTLLCRLNKPVKEAVLQSDDGSELKLSLSEEGDATLRTVTLTPRERQTYELKLVDLDGRTNKYPPEFVIDVIPNQPPELAVAFPGRDIRVSPLEEVSLEANAHDDFGLKEYGLVYQLPNTDEQALTLGEAADAEAKVVLAHQLAMEDVQAQPNELVSYYFYADDVGPDGDVRRTFSDMYFAEVRYFDEEYRQANQSQQSQQSQQGQQGDTPSTQLLQLQRDIVNAIWNLIRRERDEEPSAAFPADAQTVTDSQREAIEMGRALQERQEDAIAQQFLLEALVLMAAAEESLSSAVETPSVEPLSPARKAAYAAYQALVKLHVREHLVQQSQSQSQSQSASSSNNLNRQLQQLQLENNRNRYETEQQDQPPADREQLQVLNRLRELARRQEALNEKIRELEHALRVAQSEEERKEIERQLKRLQEEQEQMLRDLDELNERMNNEQNRSRMLDARQQAQDVRENLRRTSEALEEGQTSQALAAGTRAERELNQMKDELREKTAGQFADTMRELRQEARELSEKQQELAEKLAGGAEPEDSGPPRLKDDDDESKGLDAEFTQQRERLGELMDKLKDVIQEAEVNEPLLSKTLYDAVRETRSDRPEQSLDMARQFLRHGLDREAARAEAQARAGIDKLREGIEEAAENVLGNEVESLRRAQQEIDELSRAIGSELAQADPEGAGERQSQESDAPDQQSATSAQSPDRSQTDDDSPQRSVRNDESAGRPSEPNDSQQPGDQANQQPDDQQNQQSQQGSNSQSANSQQSESSQPGQTSESSGGRTPAEAEDQRGRPSQRSALSSFLQDGSANDAGGPTGPGGLAQPLTGADFVPWSDRMRDVEEMIDDPDLRARVARVRDRARQMRIDLKRHSRLPNWDLVRTSIYSPMLELQELLAEEIARREPTEEVVPLDRDPVPDRYVELVEQYYERLGSGR